MNFRKLKQLLDINKTAQENLDILLSPIEENNIIFHADIREWAFSYGLLSRLDSAMKQQSNSPELFNALSFASIAINSDLSSIDATNSSAISALDVLNNNNLEFDNKPIITGLALSKLDKITKKQTNLAEKNGFSGLTLESVIYAKGI